MMRKMLASLVLVLMMSAGLSAGEKLYLSRTLDLDFRRPGKVGKIAGTGPSVEEEVSANSYVLVLPKAVKMTLSIANDNDDKDHYHIRVRVQDLDLPSDKVEQIILPDTLIKDVWLAAYRYNFTVLLKDATARGRFITALVKLDVYAPKE